MLAQLPNVILFDLPGMLYPMLDEHRLEHPNQRHGISPGFSCPILAHVVDELLTLLLEVGNRNDPLLGTGSFRLCRDFLGARCEIQISDTRVS